MACTFPTNLLSRISLAAVSLCLSACMSVELPKNLVSDTAQVGKDAYRAVTGKPDSKGTDGQVSNTTIGQPNQTAAEVQKACVEEAAEKLAKAHGQKVAYTVIENSLGTINNTVSATCRVGVDKNAPKQGG
jgi:hypothetical protein